MKKLFIIFTSLFCCFVILAIVVLYFDIQSIKASQLRSERFIENTGKYVDVVEGRKLIDPDEYMKKIQGRK
jgi:hypothetical protein